MDFLKNIGETVNTALDFVVEKNRKFTKITKIKRLIKKETDSIIRSYIILGKHYYSDLSDVPNKDMQKLCKSIDESKNEIRKLKEKLTEINSEESCSNFRDLLDDEDLPIEVEVTVSDNKDKNDSDGTCNCLDNKSSDGTCNCVENIDLGDGKCHCGENTPKTPKIPRKNTKSQK